MSSCSPSWCCFGFLGVPTCTGFHCFFFFAGSSFEQTPDCVAGPTVTQRSSARTSPSPSPDLSKPCRVVSSHPFASSANSPSPPAAAPLAVAPPSHPESRIDSSSFWKSCNAAGCTQAIFTDFMNEMKDISTRIQLDQASQEGETRYLHHTVVCL